MKLVLHTFRKDVRRLWPAILISLALLATLTNTDRWRADTIINGVEGWLNLVVPLAWACLIALAVLEEPLAGDRHFWLTRPHRWPALLTAKLIFALLFVHAPSLIADAYILAARGFSPIEWLPQLLWKQLTFAAFITLPALALSTLIPSFTHFMLGMFAIAAVTAFTFVGAAGRAPYSLQRPDDYLRGEVVAILIAASAIAILFLQFRRRGAIFARAVGIAATLLAGTLVGLVPAAADYRARAVLHPADKSLALHISAPRPMPGPTPASYRRPLCAIPLELTGLPAELTYRTAALSVSVTTSDGHRYESATVSPDNVFEKAQMEARFANWYPVPVQPLWLTLNFDREVYDSLKDRNVRIAGQTVVSQVRLGETAWMPIGGRVAAPGVGHCSNSITNDRYSMGRIKVLCESPGEIPSVVRVDAWTKEDGRRYGSRLGGYGNPTTGPQNPWLSPLDRGKTFFNLSDPKYRFYKVTVEVPMEYLDNARIAVTPEIVTGYSVVTFDFPEVPLSKYWVEPRKPNPIPERK